MSGVAFEARDDERCPECGTPFAAHRAVEPGTCGSWARDPYGSTSYGYPCTLVPGHEGAHAVGGSEAFRILNEMKD
jgi:hypothetical protein